MITMKKIDQKTVELDYEGEITGEDYKRVMPKIEEEMEDVGKVKFLIDLTAAREVTVGAALRDLKFALVHFSKIGATAVVASKKTWEIYTKAVNAVFPEKIHYFEDMAPARSWLKEQAV